MGPFKHSAVSFGMSDTPPTQRQKEQRSNITAQRYNDTLLMTDKAIDKPHQLIRERALYRRNLTSRTATLHVRINPLIPYYSNKLPIISLRVINWVLQGFARACESSISKGFLFPVLPTIAPYCARVRVKWCRKPLDYASPVSFQTRCATTIPSARSMRR